MAFKYDPTADITERKFQPWPAGEYDFEVTEATPQVSKKALAEGKTEPNMIKLNIKVFNNENAHRFVYDYLMPSVAYKLKHFCEATGLDYEAANWDASDCVGRAGKLKLGIQRGTEQYPDDKNTVTDYIPGAPKAVDVDLGDEIPF